MLITLRANNGVLEKFVANLRKRNFTFCYFAFNMMHIQCSFRLLCRFIRYDCCAGYYKVAGYPGCTGGIRCNFIEQIFVFNFNHTSVIFLSVKPLINLIEITRRVGSIKFAKLIESSTFAEELKSGPPLTLFVPSDEAFDVRMSNLNI